MAESGPPPDVRPAEIQVIGCGLARTGSRSLQAALEQLGNLKCLHFFEISLTRDTEDLKLWCKAFKEGDLAKHEWDRLLNRYDALLDQPIVNFYPQLARHYPRAKFILTVRDNPEVWYHSYSFIISYSYRFMYRTAMEIVSLFFHRDKDLLYNFLYSIHSHAPHKAPNSKVEFSGKDYTMKRYLKHIDDVQNTIPSDRLLVYNVKEGWAPLCKFLAIPQLPQTPFPRKNDQNEFQEMFYNAFAKYIQFARYGISALFLGAVTTTFIYTFS